MLKSKRAILIDKINASLVPFFEGLGFQKKPSRSVEIHGEPKKHYPIGSLVRRNTDGSLEIVEIRFNTKGEAKFDIHFARASPQGGYHQYGFEPQNKISATGVGDFGMCFLGLNSHLSEAFGFRWYTRNLEWKLSKEIGKAMKCASEIEEWFVSGKVGKHLVTQEILDKGVIIYRGFHKFFIFRSVFVTWWNPLSNEIVYFLNTEECKAYAKQTLLEQNRRVNFKLYWPWEEIYHW